MRRPALLGGALAVAWLAALPALSHPISGLAEARPGWTWDPWVIGPLALSLVLFALGCIRLYRRSDGGRPLLRRRILLFGAGWLLLAAAVVSPLHQAGERSFAAHMLEHELMMLAAAPALVMSRPLAVMIWAFPSDARHGLGRLSQAAWTQRFWSALTEPITATILQATALWVWHLPSLFDRALGDAGWHAAQHLSFLVTALLFWTAMLSRSRSQPLGLAAVCLFFTSLVSGALGAFMALSSSPWYFRYAELGLNPYGLTPAEDQQLAGLLMWVPGGLVHAGAALVLVGQALRPNDARQDR